MISQTIDREQHIKDLREAIEHRATWFYFLIEEAQKRGLEPDFARDAIFRCGCFHGSHKYTKTDDLEKFAPEFANDNVRGIFDMDVQTTPEKMNIEFHYCPLVNAWKKLTDDPKRIEMLCDIAMDGDRGIASAFPAFEFHLGKTIAKGAPICEVCFTKKEK
jgi:hypothetical protein